MMLNWTAAVCKFFGFEHVRDGVYIESEDGEEKDAVEHWRRSCCIEKEKDELQKGLYLVDLYIVKALDKKTNQVRYDFCRM